MSIEVDPRTVTPARLAHFRTLGFNRLSFGVQDFDPDVQKAVHRVQSFEMVRDLMTSARELGYVSINADLIYGLAEADARELRAHGRSRSASCGPTASRCTPTRTCRSASSRSGASPTPTCRAPRSASPCSGDAIAGFLSRGYCYIGMDHFALPDDSLAVAKREGRLHRNFQGYSTQPDCDLVALGVSAIGRVGAAYYQNAKTLPEYYESLRQRRLPVVRGYALTRRRRAAARRHHGADVPGPAGVRAHRAGARREHAATTSRRSSSRCAAWRTSGLVAAGGRCDPGDGVRLVPRPRHRHGVRPPPSAEQGAASVLPGRLSRVRSCSAAFSSAASGAAGP